MHLNLFAAGPEPLDMTDTDEFRSLLASARDLGIEHSPEIAYRSRNVVLRHMRFHYLEWGHTDKPPLLLLHGGHQSAHSWDLVSLNLASRFHIFALDQRGHGDSEWARDKDYAPETMAEDALAFIDHLQLDRPIVMGHSMGGMVTMAMLRRRPGFASAAVVVDVGPEISPAGTATIRSFVETSSEFAHLEDFVQKVRGYDPFRSAAHIERTVRYNLVRRADGKYVTKCDRHLESSRTEPGMPDRVSLADVANFACPVLIVRGAQSNILEPAAAERFSRALPAGTLVTVENCGHNVHSQNTPGFLSAVRPFLERTS